MNTAHGRPSRMNPKSASAHKRAPVAFTLIELMVVIAAVAILAAVLLPGLVRGNQQAEGDQCMSDLKQLTEGWLMFNSDNGGKFPASGGEGAQGADNPQSPDLRPGGANSQWCPGRQDAVVAPSENWLSPSTLPPGAPNIGWEWIQAGLIYPYVKSVQVYLCPADESFNLIAGMRYPHVRSKSMNAWIQPLGGAAWNNGADDANLRVYTKESDLTVPGPVNTFLLVDESPQTINDASFVADPTEPSIENPGWVDCPATYHNEACGISFCDGHVGLKKWRDPTVLAQRSAALAADGWEAPEVSKYEPDVLWMVNRSKAAGCPVR